MPSPGGCGETSANTGAGLNAMTTKARGVVCPLVTETGLWEHLVVCRAPPLTCEVQRGHTSPGWCEQGAQHPTWYFPGHFSPPTCWSASLGTSEPTQALPRHPPVIFLLEIADGDDTGAAAHSELVLIGGPAHTASSPVDPQDDERGLPRAALQRPHVGVAVCAAGHNAVTLRGPVNACGMGREHWVEAN